ncbi:hypothetical protein E1200_25210 [Actinomadura sp. GC306]|uniref:hypothetical protein n=1 Tax=Actinomadura sp. GC306 TaxID=2530367 RepID=UPI0010533F6A|nr:hypothetical protein [Actinomadura sp. GC306]TDC62586.1 hypothetical protein E1200_25210 [Actinomadura sp. GC306]
MKRKREDDESGRRAKARIDDAKGYVSTLTPELSGALAELEKHGAAQDDGKKKTAGRGKTARADVVSSAPARPALTRMPSLLIAREHKLPAMAVVKLRPTVELDGDRITDVVISAGHRTPSPFGARMGDHTVAWVVIVDSLRALLYNLTLEEAVAALRKHHKETSAWMADKESTTKKLLLLLRHPQPERSAEERMDRVLRLEDAAHRTELHLTEAESLLAKNATTSNERVREELELAIGQHLAFVNYLPFATVRSARGRGSTGSTEGHYRKIVMRVEAPDVPASVDEVAEVAETDTGAEDEVAELLDSDTTEAPATDQAEKDEEPETVAPVLTRKHVREALWRLFAFDAALRAAEAGLALRPPGVGEQVTTLHAEIIGRAKQAQEQLMLYAPGGRKKSATPPDHGLLESLRAKATDDGEALRKRADARGLSSDDPLALVAGFTVDIANVILNKGSRKAADRDRLIAKLNAQFAAAELARAGVVAQERTGVGDAALVLAHLVHDHQSSVAAAYPAAVRESNFLSPEPPSETPLTLPSLESSAEPKRGTESMKVDAEPAQEAETDPVGAAVERLRIEIRRSPNIELTTGAKEDPLDKLVTAFTRAYKSLGEVPVAGEPNGWAANRKARHLVVAHDPKLLKEGKPTLTVQGRAAAPRGVAGMGSHTTAWIVEVAAADALASVPDAVLENFARAVRDDLGSGVMALDVYLPVAQLVGGQLEQLFDAAARVLRATSVATAATAYLQFRNLLPFATVDAGSRGGHGEGLDVPMEKLFDHGSLQEAAELQADALTGPDTRKEAVQALEGAADNLVKLSKATWMSDTCVESAVPVCATRLRRFAADLTAGAPEDVSRVILATRWLAHKETYELARTSRMMGKPKPQ